MLAGAHYLVGGVLGHGGQFPASRVHLERAVELFAAGLSHNYGAWFAQAASYLLVGTLTALGYLSTALSRAEELLEAARRSSDPFSIAAGLAMNGMINLPLRDTRVLAERADEILSIATEHEMAVYLISAAFFRGWAMAAAGRAEEGMAEMRRSISNPVIAGTLTTPLMLVALAETCCENRRAEEGLDLVTEGLATAEETGLRFFQAELHRIEGELLMIKDPGNVADAERCLGVAIDVARRQGARLYELRATASLARLLKKQGKTEEARQMLSEIYDWFTEGFGTNDLKDAKALLDELKG
jgi:predicted ATPase